MGAQKWPPKPQTPKRSERRGGAVALLDNGRDFRRLPR